MKDKKHVETSSNSSSLSKDGYENKDDEDDDQAFSSSSNVDEETIKLIKKVMKNIRKMNRMCVAIQVKDIYFSQFKEDNSENKGCYGLRQEGALYGGLSKQANTQRQEKEVQGQGSCINQDLG